jgi:NRAMP (natural resistance-associated macrophage protein)-like metal ion transporter
VNKLKKYWRVLGPGFVTGAADDDPSGIATYSQTGAQFGYGQLWLALFTFPFMTLIQEMCGRIGAVTGQGLAGVIGRHYSKPVLYGAVSLLLVANTINIGANLGAMASSARLLYGLPFGAWLLIITALTLILQVFVSYRTYARYLKWLALTLLAYVVTAFVVQQDWAAILAATVIPTIVFSKAFLLNIVAILGTTISPYLFFWQASEEVEEAIAHRRLTIRFLRPPKVDRALLHRMRVDTISGMFFSNIVMFFIIATAASTLHSAGITEIQTADQAAEALRPLAGDLTYLLFAAGIIGTGLLAVPVLAGSASYALSETFGWKEGLYRKFRQAHGFYGVITVATLVGLLVNFSGVPPFQMLYYTAVINGLCAPPLLFLILKISSNQKIMRGYTTHPVPRTLGWLLTGIMGLGGALLLLAFAGVW